MKTRFNIFVISSLLLIGQFFYSCQKEEAEEDQNEYSVCFGISIPETDTKSAFKNSEVELSNAKCIIITIKNSDESQTTYNSSKLNLYVLNGYYYSQKILLPPGSYSITEFLIADSTNNIIFAAPTTGSELAKVVTTPIPISFSVEKDQSNKVNIEVITTESYSCSDFGIVWFPIKEINILKVPVTVVDLNTSKFLQAKLTVQFNSELLEFDLDANAKNYISVPDDYPEYTLTINKEEYCSYSCKFSLDSLKALSSSISGIPLLIELKKEDIFLTDIDGNVYKAVRIGTQIWMAENLRVTHYRDGSEIYLENRPFDTICRSCYNFNPNNFVNIFGVLYEGSYLKRKEIAPEGWHTPTTAEWQILIDYLGGSEVAGGKLKEVGTKYWHSPNSGATNETGFNARPGGYHGVTGGYSNVGHLGYWWASDSLIIYGNQGYVKLDYNSNELFIGETDPTIDFSIRCVKD